MRRETRKEGKKIKKIWKWVTGKREKVSGGKRLKKDRQRRELGNEGDRSKTVNKKRWKWATERKKELWGKFDWERQTRKMKGEK